MKKVALSLLVLASLGLAVISCDKDDDKKETYCWDFTFDADCNDDNMQLTIDDFSECDLTADQAEVIREATEAQYGELNKDCTITVTKSKQ